ncbi:hypothetical protein Zmor_005470 [Zophobas morio]|uniref:C2H2-type domain-containing protein n=1 Tax=Zophobas morio TaxID=2755281 RepID=A0AA38IXT0_9CUCU|nr:hypothetical protein Zmor_005470 [Zophobas morio]
MNKTREPNTSTKLTPAGTTVKNAQYFCSKCRETFHSYHELTIHDKSCVKPRVPHVCKYCRKDFSSAYSLKLHIARHETAPQYACAKCGKGFSNIEAKEYHEDTLHTEFFDACAEGGVQCKLCDVKAVNKTMMDKHIKANHTVEAPCLCDVCGKSFDTRKKLFLHQVVHETGKSWQCEYCSKSFKHKNALNAHMNIHEVRSFECDECGRTFKKKFTLNCHKKEHLGQYTFQCHVCGKNFVCKSSAIHHMKRHTE